MVLRGEWVDEIAALRLQFEQKDIEVERLKDLCLWQREEIWTLKGAVFFPATQPDHNLTGQIQYLAEKIAVAPSSTAKMAAAAAAPISIHIPSLLPHLRERPWAKEVTVATASAYGRGGHRGNNNRPWAEEVREEGGNAHGGAVQERQENTLLKSELEKLQELGRALRDERARQEAISLPKLRHRGSLQRERRHCRRRGGHRRIARFATRSK
uniref:Uncharacterized protein n=1 Tax=Oryza glumipatula TaxID=40148 RepID=A0A0E0A2C3_9ORYZ